MVELVRPDAADDAQHREQQRRGEGVEERQAGVEDVNGRDDGHRQHNGGSDMIPRVTPPSARPIVSSSGLSGGISMSTMLPWILAIISDEVVIAKAFCTIGHHDQARREEFEIGQAVDLALLSTEGQEEDREKEQRRHHRRRQGLQRHLEKAAHFAHIEGPEA